jgi:hypothetical protein
VILGRTPCQLLGLGGPETDALLRFEILLAALLALAVEMAGLEMVELEVPQL